jgi:hypothetical protein
LENPFQPVMIASKRISYYQLINISNANMRAFGIEIENTINMTYHNNIVVVNENHADHT